jgi:arabinogalactan oligomer/maltooligosaccharide transport system substrate-binding protein
MRSSRSAAALLSTLVLVLAACSSGGTGTAAPASTTPSQAPAESAAGGSAAAGGELVIWADDKRAAALKPLAAQFGTENGVTVKVEAISKDIQTKFKTAAGQGQGPDIVVWAHDVIGDYVSNGFIDPVEMSDTSPFDPLAIKGMTFDGQLYGVPYAVENIGLFRNTDLVPDAPKSLSELLETGKKLVADGKVQNIMSLQVGQNGDPYHIYPLFAAAGGSFFGKTANGDPDPKNVTVDSPESIAAGEKLAGIGEKGEKALKTSIDNTNAIPLFFNKKTAFLVSGPWAVADITKAGTKYDISPIPGWDGGTAGPFIGAQGFYISSKAKNKVLAQEFVTVFLATPEVQVALYQAEPRRPALLAAVDQVKTTDPNIEKFQAASEGGTILPAIPAMGAVWDPFGKAESAIVRGDDVTKSLTAAAKAIRDAIAKLK